MIKAILQDNQNFKKMVAWKSVMLSFFGDDNVVFNNGEKWKRTRLIIQPIFGKLSIFFEPMILKVDQLLNMWEKRSEDLNIGGDIKKMTLDVLGICVLGKDFNFLENNGVEGPLNSYLNIMKYGTKFMSLTLPEVIYRNLPFKSTKNLLKEIDNFNSFINNLIIEMQSSTVKDEKKTLIHLLLEANSENLIPIETIRDNAVIFFVAGHETTANALYFILYSLAQYPEVQEKLRQEINSVFPDNVEPEKVRDIEYLAHVIDETLRLYPPSGMLGARIPTEDTLIDNWFFQKGYQYMINIYSLHRNKKVWGDDVDEFNPDRFKNLTKEQKNSHIPFGGGPRKCVGMMFTLYEQKIFISKLLKKFRISLIPGSKLEYANDLMEPKTESGRFKLDLI
jgi:cytochrome P450